MRRRAPTAEQRRARWPQHLRIAATGLMLCGADAVDAPYSVDVDTRPHELDRDIVWCSECTALMRRQLPAPKQQRARARGRGRVLDAEFTEVERT